MKKTIAIIGGGPASMMLASALDPGKFEVTIYEKNNAPGRKFLVAGDGGFNLTHSEAAESFLSRYHPSWFFEKPFNAFNNTDLRKWLAGIGIETFTGSSGRVFPAKGIKPVDVLNAVLRFLKEKNVAIKTRHEWKGWNSANELVFQTTEGESTVHADITVFALGGASWPVTGSAGDWLQFFAKREIEVKPFESSNAAALIEWPAEFIRSAEGQSLKNISVSCGGMLRNGELLITAQGLEGGAVYALAPAIRIGLQQEKYAALSLDLKPSLSLENILEKFSKRGNRSVTKLLEDALSFTKIHIALLKAFLTKEEFTDLEQLAQKIKNIQLTVHGLAPLEEAISTVGGIPLAEVDENFQLKKMPGVYCIGEMLDWDAPTGGYLLQGCFSMGAFLAAKLNREPE